MLIPKQKFLDILNIVYKECSIDDKHFMDEMFNDIHKRNYITKLVEHELVDYIEVEKKHLDWVKEHYNNESII